MAGMTTAQIVAMSDDDIAKRFRNAHQMQAEHSGFTWEYGADLVNIVAHHGNLIADKILAARLRVETVPYLCPWQKPELSGWSIVGMNHYILGKESDPRLYVAMTNNERRVIQAEGLDNANVWISLISQAEDH